MAGSVKHKFRSTVPDEGDPKLIRPSNWNDEHDIAGLQLDTGDLSVATSVALTDKMPVLQGTTHRSATVDQVRDAVFGDDWNDLVIPGTAVNPLGAASDPILNQNTGLYEFSASLDNVMIFVFQLPHGWSGHYDATKAVVSPHLHCRFLTSTAAPNNVSRWKLEYDVADPNGNFANAYNAWTTAGTVSWTNPANTAKCELVELTDIDLAGHKGSCVLHCRVTRLAGSDNADTDGSVVALYSADLHIQHRTAGSELEYPS